MFRGTHSSTCRRPEESRLLIKFLPQVRGQPLGGLVGAWGGSRVHPLGLCSSAVYTTAPPPLAPALHLLPA